MPLSTMLMCLWVLCSCAFEYYTHVPLSTMLMCLWVLYSSAFEYYAHVPLSTILMCLWKTILSIRIWVYEMIFYWKKLFHSPPKMILLYKIDAIFINIITLICIIYTNPHHLSPTFSSLPPTTHPLPPLYDYQFTSLRLFIKSIFPKICI